MNLSSTGKPLCANCRKLATHEGNVYRSNGDLACMMYCADHQREYADAQPLGYYRDHFPFIDHLCQAVDVHQLARVRHPVSGERAILTHVICALFSAGWTQAEVRRWLTSIADQPGKTRYHLSPVRERMYRQDEGIWHKMCDICHEIAVLAYLAQDGSYLRIHACADCVADMAIMNSDNCLFFFGEEWTVRQIRAWQRDHQPC